MGRYKRYSDEERAAALVALEANDGNVSKTSREIGVAPTTLTQWRNGMHHPVVSQMRDVKRDEITRLLNERLLETLGAITADKLRGASAKDLWTGAGIGVDKLIALLGETPPQHNTQINLFLKTTFGSDELPEF